MTSIEQVKKWVQHRIDYFEDVVEKQSTNLETITDATDAWAEGVSRGEEIGMRDAFQMVMECITGQRR